MNNDCRGGGGDNKECCYFHPKEIIVGVCHLCLYEKLLILSNNNSNQTKPNSSTFHSKIFALGSLIHHRFESRHRKSDNSDSDASTSHEGIYICSLSLSLPIFYFLFEFLKFSLKYRYGKVVLMCAVCFVKEGCVV